MRLLDAAWLAAREIRAQRLRSGLMMIGVTVAVGFLIALVSILHGSRRKLEKVWSVYGSTNAFMLTQHGSITSYDAFMKARNAHPPPITVSDAHAIAPRLPAGSRMAFMQTTYTQMPIPGTPKPSLMYVVALGGDYFTILNPTIQEGRALAPVEIDKGANVAVISSGAADALLPHVEALGKRVILMGVPYTVVGVLAPDVDRPWNPISIDIPFGSPGQRMLGPPDQLDAIVVDADSSAQVPLARDAVREVMRIQHHLRPRVADDFGISTGHEWVDIIEKQTRQFVIAGIVLPSVGLLVGAIVIANIMLVAVVERTREIGIRRALGARRRDVMRQFLAEATILSVSGAAIGVLLGLAASDVLARVPGGFPAAIAPWSMGLGLALGIVVGVVAGVYPATRAARLDPIRALRRET